MFLFVCLFVFPCFFFFFFSPCYSSVPAVHLITTVYSTVVRTRECVCVREAGRVTAALTHSMFLFCFFLLYAYYMLIFFKDYNQSQVCVCGTAGSFLSAKRRESSGCDRSFAFPAVDGE